MSNEAGPRSGDAGDGGCGSGEASRWFAAVCSSVYRESITFFNLRSTPVLLPTRNEAATFDGSARCRAANGSQASDPQEYASTRPEMTLSLVSMCDKTVLTLSKACGTEASQKRDNALETPPQTDLYFQVLHSWFVVLAFSWAEPGTVSEQPAEEAFAISEGRSFGQAQGKTSTRARATLAYCKH